MLLQDKKSLRSVNARTVSAAIGTTPRFDEVPLTDGARQALQQNLASMRVEQSAIPARLRVAREFGDTSNNDEHLAIREEEAVLATRIARLEDILARATDVDHPGDEDSVTIGSTVTVVDVNTRERLDYVIASAHGAVSRGRVSALSPLGQALLGRSVGERVSVIRPAAHRLRAGAGRRHPRKCTVPPMVPQPGTAQPWGMTAAAPPLRFGCVHAR